MVSFVFTILLNRIEIRSEYRIYSIKDPSAFILNLALRTWSLFDLKLA